MTVISCGIDFGTTNSAVGVARGAERALVMLEGDRSLLPSAMFFPPRGGTLFGRAAIDHYLAGGEGRLLRGLKKILGTALMQEKTNLGHQSLSFTAILQIFVANLKHAAEQAHGQEIRHVVMGRPVHFHDGNPDADGMAQQTLENIAQAAGFTHVEFLYEPIAAAFAHEEHVAGEKRALVVDLGGGTSDFTVIRLSRARMGAFDRADDILATAGVRVGGTSFDYKLSMQNFMPFLGLDDYYQDRFDAEKWLPMPRAVYQNLSDWPFVPLAHTHQAIRQTQELLPQAEDETKLERLLSVQEEQRGYALLEAVEGAKIRLTDAETCAIDLAWLPDMEEESVTRAQLEEAIADDVARVMESLQDCLRKAQVAARDIELVILTGGSSALPVIQKRVRALLPQAHLSQGNRMDSVGLGLAYHSGRIFGG